MFNILRLTDLINCEGTVIYSVRAVGRSVVRLPGPCSLHHHHPLLLLTLIALPPFTQVYSGYDDHNADWGLKVL